MLRHSPLRVTLVCLTVLLAAGAWGDSPRTVQLTILHTNDTHGHLLPYSYPETFDPGTELSMLEARTDIGGIARRATMIKRVRAEKGHATLVLDAGDVCDGTPFSTEYHGMADVTAMNAARYDVACLGNHEFNHTFPELRKLIAQAKRPVVCANVHPLDGVELTRPYVIKRIAGVRVGIFGLVTSSAKTYPGAKGSVVIDDPVAVAGRIVPELREQCDIVVALTHIGVDVDRELAEKVPGIDIIVGGDSHTLLKQPEFIAAHGTAPRGGVNGTVIVQDFQWAGTLGRLDVSLEPSSTGGWVVGKYSGKLLPVTSSVPDDPATAKVVSTYWKPITAKYGEVIGTAAGDFAQKGDDAAEYNLMADAMRAATGAEFDLQNVGGVRAAVVKGPITNAVIAEVDPFSNTVVTFKIAGAALKRLLLRYRPAVSGIRYEVADRKLVRAEVGGAPIDDARVYSGSTNSFMAERMLEGATDKQDTGKTRRDTLTAYIRKQGTVSPAYDGRRIVRGE